MKVAISILFLFVASLSFAKDDCQIDFNNICRGDSVSVSETVKQLFDASRGNMDSYKRLAELARNQLYEPTSPTVDDEAYLIVVDRLLADSLLSQADLIRLEDAHNNMMRNRVGHKATDFEMITRQGRRICLSDAVKTHPRSLLMFYDPDCNDCNEMEHYLQATLAESVVGVIMVCPYGVERAEWTSHAAEMPQSWTVGLPANEDFENDELYELRATPTLYLVDSEMTVLAKNISRMTIGQIVGKDLQ